MKNRTNKEWVRELAVTGAGQAQAIEDLRLVLRRGALYVFSRHLIDSKAHPHEKILGLAEDCAQDALLAILARLHEFRGDSQFTTWAYKFAIHFALATSRREAWKGVSIEQLQEETGSFDWRFHDQHFRLDPELPTLQSEIWKIIRQVIRSELTDRQRQVLKLMVFDQVPMDVVVERLNTNRNAVYQLLHDARVKIKARLLAHGYDIQEAYDLFNQDR